jgi:DNA phosphorothioation-dependent restriction protein DptH
MGLLMDVITLQVDVFDAIKSTKSQNRRVSRIQEKEEARARKLEAKKNKEKRKNMVKYNKALEYFRAGIGDMPNPADYGIDAVELKKSVDMNKELSEKIAKDNFRNNTVIDAPSYETYETYSDDCQVDADRSTEKEEVGTYAKPASEDEKKKQPSSRGKGTSLSIPAVNIVLGKEIGMSGGKVVYSPNNTVTTNNLLYGVIGKSGTGKTQYLKSHLYQLHKQSGVGVLIFDIKGDYTGGDEPDFAKSVNAKVVQPYNMGFNPLTVNGTLPRQPIHTARTFATTVAKIYGLGQKQIGRLLDAISQTYTEFGIDSDKPDTWTKDAPTIHDVKNKFDKIEEESNTYDKLNKMLDDMDSMCIFHPNAKEANGSLFGFIDGVTVISLSGYDEATQNIVIALLLDLFHSQMHLQGKSKITNNLRQMKKFILVDEAKEIMERGFDSLGRIMLQGREFGVGVILSTQELSHFKFGNYHDAISNWVILGSESTASDISEIFSVDSKTANSLKIKIGKLESHTSYVVDARKEFKMIVNNSFYKLFKSTSRVL